MTTATSDRYLVTPLGVPLALPYTPHYPHPPQEAFLALDCLEAFYGGAAGPGKSDALLMAALQYVHVPRYAAIIFRRTYEDLSLPGALIPRSKEWLGPTLGMQAWNEQRHRWTFPSGATLSFGYLQHADDHLRYQGAEFQFVGVDEASQIREAQLRYMFSRLRKPDVGSLSGVPLRMRLASNPGDRSHEYLKRRYIDKQVDPDDAEDTEERARRRVFIRARLQDNPSLDQRAYRESLSHLEPEVRAQLLDGDWDARQPGDWYFDDGHLAAVADLGRAYEDALQEALREDDGIPFVAGGAAHLGIDWGESSSAVLLLPLETGGFFAAREVHLSGSEPADSTRRMLALNALGLPWGRAFFDAAGVQSQRTFNATADRLLGNARPRAKGIPFGADAPRTAASARRSFKGVGAMYLRRTARRAHGAWVKDGQEVTEGVTGAIFLPGPLPGHLAISPRCPELLRQLRLLKRNPEDRQGAWLKDDGQHGADALLAGVAMTAVRLRATAKPAKIAA
jgi:hypothetical protein